MNRAVAPTKGGGQERAIERLVGWVRATGLAPVAALFLEMGKPLSLIAGQALFFAQPVLGYVGPMFGLFADKGQIAEYAMLFEDSANVDRMVASLREDVPVRDGWT